MLDLGNYLDTFGRCEITNAILFIKHIVCETNYRLIFCQVNPAAKLHFIDLFSRIFANFLFVLIANCV